MTEALERLKSSEKDEDKPVMTKKERDCIIASLELDVSHLENVVEEKDAEIANKNAENASLMAENASQAARIKELEAQLAARDAK